MDTSIEKNIQRIKRFSLSCTLNDNGTLRYFHNGHEYVEIGGIKWAVCNVGAKKPTDSGLYFQWGDTQGFTVEQVGGGEGKKYFGWADYKYGNYDSLTKYGTSDKKILLEPQDDAATFNMGVGWKTPTKEEFKVLVDSTTSKWVKNYQGSGVGGRLFTDKKDKTKQLFFPSAGCCGNGSVGIVGSYGYYWSSSLDTSSVIYGRYLYFISGFCSMSSSNRYLGFAVRGVVG